MIATFKKLMLGLVPFMFCASVGMATEAMEV